MRGEGGRDYSHRRTDTFHRWKERRNDRALRRIPAIFIHALFIYSINRQLDTMELTIDRSQSTLSNRKYSCCLLAFFRSKDGMCFKCRSIHFASEVYDLSLDSPFRKLIIIKLATAFFKMTGDTKNNRSFLVKFFEFFFCC